MIEIIRTLLLIAWKVIFDPQAVFFRWPRVTPGRVRLHWRDPQMNEHESKEAELAEVLDAFNAFHEYRTYRDEDGTNYSYFLVYHSDRTGLDIGIDGFDDKDGLYDIEIHDPRIRYCGPFRVVQDYGNVEYSLPRDAVEKVIRLVVLHRKGEIQETAHKLQEEVR